MRVHVFVLCVSIAGCSDGGQSSHPPATASPVVAPMAGVNGPAGEEQAGDESDDELGPSKRTIEEAQSFLKPGMTSDEFHQFVNTIPSLVRKDRFHWVLHDGSLWTDVEMRPEGAVIVNVEVERKKP